METSEEWSGLDAALHELGMLCGENSHRSVMKDRQEKYRRPNGMLVSPYSSKRQQRHLLTNQLWNRPDILSEVEVEGVQDDYIKNIPTISDSENTENSFLIKPCKLGKNPEPKSGMTYRTIKPIPIGLPEVNTENNGLNVLKMNSDYITGVTIGTFGSSRDGFNRSETCVHPGSSQSSTSRHGLTVPSLRPHHLRPYEIPRRREERVRTTSETAENGSGIAPMANLDTSFNHLALGSGRKVSREKMWGSLLKSRSLENVRISENEVLQVPTHEMDSMSKRIQHLHVE